MHGYGAPNGSLVNNDRPLDTRVFFTPLKTFPCLHPCSSTLLTALPGYKLPFDIKNIKISNIRIAVRVSATFHSGTSSPNAREIQPRERLLPIGLFPALVLLWVVLFHGVIFAYRILQPRGLAVTAQKYYCVRYLLLLLNNIGFINMSRARIIEFDFSARVLGVPRLNSKGQL